jgi:hypothetical protein
VRRQAPAFEADFPPGHEAFKAVIDGANELEKKAAAKKAKGGRK